MKMKMYGHMNGNNNKNSKLVEWLSSTRIGKLRPVKRFRYSVYGLTKEEKKAIQNYKIEQRNVKEVPIRTLLTKKV